jgi:hypothetical protein
MATNGATHFLYTFDTVLDTDTVLEGADIQPGGVLLFDALCLDGGKVPAGTRVEFRCESRERATGERVWGVVLP